MTVDVVSDTRSAVKVVMAVQYSRAAVNGAMAASSALIAWAAGDTVFGVAGPPARRSTGGTADDDTRVNLLADAAPRERKRRKEKEEQQASEEREEKESRKSSVRRVCVV